MSRCLSESNSGIHSPFRVVVEDEVEDQTAFGQDIGLDLECDWGLAVHSFKGENWRLAEREDCFQVCIGGFAPPREVFDDVFYAVAAGW
jgi:hypothetical protein